jgi:ATP-dependent helicase/nuclease subunit A
MNAKPAPKPPSTAAADFRLAASPDHSLWVNASAGTGKTNILTRRVLGLLLHGQSAHKILCLTFTKAAAAEMAQRIRQQLSAWTLLDAPALTRQLCEIVDAHTVDEAMLARAQNLFARCLDIPDGMKIQTIHAFCQHVLQRFPIEAGLIPNFRIVDEGEAKIWQAGALDQVLSAAKNDAAARADFELLAEYCASPEQLLGLLRQWAAERQHWQDALRAHGGIDTMLGQAARLMDLEPPLNKSAYLAQACVDEALAVKELRNATALLGESGKTDRARAQSIAGFLARAPNDRADFFPLYASAFLTATGEIRKQLYAKAFAENHADAAAALEREAARVQGVDQQLRLRQLLGNSHAALRLCSAWAEAYGRRKSAAHALDYNDLIQHTLALLQKPGVAPWILYKLDGGLDHILIDEAQDTSPEQWAIIRALTADFFTGDTAPGRRVTVFAVGDPKQSIYSFQGADPHGFMRMHGNYQRDAFAASKNLVTLPLQISYRSTKPILQLVDSVFTTTPAEAGVRYFHLAERVQAEARQEITLEHISIRDAAPGLVEIWPLQPEAEKAAIDPWQTPETRQGARGGEQMLAQAIAAQIATWLERGEMLPENAITKRPMRKMRAGDIIILLQRRHSLVGALTRALKQYRIPVSGADRLILTDHIAIQDLLAMARFCFLPQDDFNLACLLKSPLLGWPVDTVEERLFRAAHGRGDVTLWQKLQDLAQTDPSGPWPETVAYLQGLIARAQTQTAAEFFSQVLLADGGRSAFLNRLGSECLDPLDELMNLCWQKRENLPELRRFVDWIAAEQPQIKRDLAGGDLDQVRIMTVHAAKGLQAPVVFLPDTNLLGRGGRQVADWLVDEKNHLLLWPGSAANVTGAAKAWQNRARLGELEEYRRLLYVAMTRAEDRLYIANHGKTQSESWFSYIRQAAHSLAQDGQAEPVEFDFAALGFPEWRGAGWRIRFGAAAPDAAAQSAASVPPKTALPDWWHTQAPNEAAPARIIRPSGVGDALLSPLAARRGDIIHRLLQTLPELPPAQRTASAARFLGQLRPELANNEQAQIMAEVLALFTDPAHSEFFAPGQSEVPIAGKVDGVMIRGQIDRLVIGARDVWLLDYKTSQTPPHDMAEIIRRYGRQISGYTQLLTRIYPGHTIHPAILFTHNASLWRLRVAELPRVA